MFIGAQLASALRIQRMIFEPFLKRFLDQSAVLSQAHSARTGQGRFKAALLRVLRSISKISRAVRTAS